MALKRWDPKDPADVVDYWIDWDAEGFATAPLTIAAHTNTIADDEDQPPPTGTNNYLSIVSSGHGDAVEGHRTGTMQRIRFAGGEPGQKYPVECTVTLSDGQVRNITMTLTIKERTKA